MTSKLATIDEVTHVCIQYLWLCIDLSCTTGRGGLILFEESEGVQGFREVRRYVWRDGLFDVTWSEVNEAILVAAAGDGSVLIFDQNLADAPAMVLPGHTAEVRRSVLLTYFVASSPPEFFESWEWSGNKTYPARPSQLFLVYIDKAEKNRAGI